MDRSKDFIEVHVGAIKFDKEIGAPVIVLTDESNRYSLPIWIGLPEARAIGLALSKITTPRPLTHDLLISVVKAFGYKVTEVLVDEHETTSDVFQAKIVLHSQRKGLASEISFDSRPSDAVALAVMEGARILCARHLMEVDEPQLAKSDPDRMAFRSFVDGIKASDFNLAVLDKLAAEKLKEDATEITEDSDEKQV